MSQYFSTFASGLGEVVKTGLKDKVPDVEIKLLLDGLVVYDTGLESDRIKEIRFFNNSFVLLFFTQDSLKAIMKQALDNPDLVAKIKKYIPGKNWSFRIVASEENQLVAVDKNLLKSLEEVFSQTTKAKVNRSNPDFEIWFLVRSEGYGLAGLRITKTPNYEKTLQKGELRPELANLMCLMAELKPSDIVLDPFAGYGAIPLECLKSFSVGKVMAGEKDQDVFKILQEKIKKTGLKVSAGRWDALNLNSLANGSIDKIITDPPWGFYGDIDVNMGKFYQQMLEEFIGVLKPKGLMIFLMGRKELFEIILAQFSALKLIEKYNILVSGKKAAVYKIKKNGGKSGKMVGDG